MRTWPMQQGSKRAKLNPRAWMYLTAQQYCRHADVCDPPDWAHLGEEA